MRFQLIVNSFDVTSYIKEGGIDISYVDRVTRSVETMDGKKHYASIQKLKISVSLLDRLYDTSYQLLASTLTTNPASVSYTNFDTGSVYTGTFYIFDKSHKPFKSFAGVTLINDGSFTLEEQ